MRYLVLLMSAVLIGCGSFEDRAPASGHATARLHIEGNGLCSLEYLKHELWRMERLGFSCEYRDRFAKAYQGTCDRHYTALVRQAEACKKDPSIPCPKQQ